MILQKISNPSQLLSPPYYSGRESKGSSNLDTSELLVDEPTDHVEKEWGQLELHTVQDQCHRDSVKEKG